MKIYPPNKNALLVFVSLLALSACAGDYKQAATAFHTASSEMTQTISDQSDAVAHVGFQVRRDLAIDEPIRVRTKAGQCDTEDTEGCELEFRNDKNANPEPLRAERKPLQNTLALALAIEVYALSLKDIAHSDTIGEIDTAITEASGALEGLAKTASEVTGTKTTASAIAYVQPVSAAAGWIFGQYVKHAQLDALRAATSAAEGVNPDFGPMSQASSAFARALDKAAATMRPILARAVSETEDDFTDKPSEKVFDLYVAAAETFDQLIKAKANRIPEKLRKAHKKLHEALQRDDVENLKDFFVLVNEAREEISVLKRIIEDILAVSKG